MSKIWILSFVAVLALVPVQCVAQPTPVDETPVAGAARIRVVQDTSGLACEAGQFPAPVECLVDLETAVLQCAGDVPVVVSDNESLDALFSAATGIQGSFTETAPTDGGHLVTIEYWDGFDSHRWSSYQMPEPGFEVLSLVLMLRDESRQERGLSLFNRCSSYSPGETPAE